MVYDSCGNLQKFTTGKNESGKEMVKFRDFAEEFAGLFGEGGKEKVKELVKFLWRSGSCSGSL